MMYEKLVKSLRNCVADENGCCFQCPEDCNGPCQENLMTEAADAIEKLSMKLHGDEAAIAGMQREIEHMVVYGNKPRWIPAERLPEKAGKYLVCGRWRGKQAKIWVCEFMTLGCLKGWVNNAAYPSVSHWMPLPEPPKEE